MTAEAHHHYDDLDRLNPGQADAVRAVVLQLVTATDSELTDNDKSDEPPPRQFPFASSISAEPNFAERSEDILNEMAQRNAG